MIAFTRNRDMVDTKSLPTRYAHEEKAMPKTSAAKVSRTIVQPHVITLAELAAYLGFSPSALANLMPQLHKAGLPAAGSWAYRTEPPSMPG